MSNCTNNSAMCGFAQQTRGSLVNIIAVIGTFSRLSPLDPTRHPAGESTGDPTRWPWPMPWAQLSTHFTPCLIFTHTRIP
jgi:hypothetical protein